MLNKMVTVFINNLLLLSDISGHYDDPLLPVLIHLRQSELADSTLISVSKGLLQQTLESAV